MKRRERLKGKERLRRQRGLSLVEVLIAVTLLGLITLIVQRVFEKSTRLHNGLLAKTEVSILRDVVRAQVSCEQSARGVVAGPVVLRNASGGALGRSDTIVELGPWEVQATYAAGADHFAVLFRYTGKGAQPPSAELLKSAHAWAPLFGGEGLYCRELLAPPSPRTGPGAHRDPPPVIGGGTQCPDGSNYYGLREDNSPRCCRVRVAESAAAFETAMARCAPNEYLVSGGGRCIGAPSADHAGTPQDHLSSTFMGSNGYATALELSLPLVEGGISVGWNARCASNWNPVDQTWAVAYAQCCPF